MAQSRLWPKGTLCITIAANIAETAILGIDACFPDSIVGFIPNEQICNPLFVEFFIRTVKADLAAFAPATAQKNINLETLEVVHVPSPPLIEQGPIVDRIDAAFNRIDRTAREASRATHLLDRLEQATLAQAFRGELVREDSSQFERGTEYPANRIDQGAKESMNAAIKPYRRCPRARPTTWCGRSRRTAGH